MIIRPQGHPDPAPNTDGWNRVLLNAAVWLVTDCRDSKRLDADGTRKHLLAQMDEERRVRQWPAILYNQAGRYYAEAIHIVFRVRVTPFPLAID